MTSGAKSWQRFYGNYSRFIWSAVGVLLIGITGWGVAATVSAPDFHSSGKSFPEVVLLWLVGTAATLWLTGMGIMISAIVASFIFHKFQNQKVTLIGEEKSPAKRDRGPAWIIAIALVVCMVIYALSTRYVHVGQGRVLDKWTGQKR